MASLYQGLIQGLDRVTSHPPWALIYSFMIFHQNFLQVQSQEHRLSKFPGGMPPDPLARACYTSKMQSVFHTLCKLGQHCQTLTLNSVAIRFIIMYMIDPTKLKPKPATHLDLFWDQCLYTYFRLMNVHSYHFHT